MKVLTNNCVSKIKVPKTVKKVHGFDYNPALDLFATFNYDDYDVFVWNPVSGQVVAKFKDCLGEGPRDTLFLPGDRVGVSSSEAHHGGSVEIYTFGKGKSKPAKFEIDKDLPMTYPGFLALSPKKTLLVLSGFGEGVYEILMDWDNLKVTSSREIELGLDYESEGDFALLCCSQDFQVSTYVTFPSVISTAKVRLHSNEEVQTEEEVTITYYMLDGVKKEIGEKVTGLVHDGQNLIIASEDEIVLLESMTEGSKAHLIASDVKPSGQMRINREGLLMVCEEKVIKLFEYGCNPKSLQVLCRGIIRNTICTDYRDKVNSLGIPSILKDFLLYK